MTRSKRCRSDTVGPTDETFRPLAGGTMDNLVKMTIYLVDIKNNTEVWRARREFFTGDFPASSLVEVRSLAKPEVLVEIEAVAYLGRS
jgi:enamine deaminase RidA (YjgF/YER057c/UK114 family)